MKICEVCPNRSVKFVGVDAFGLGILESGSCITLIVDHSYTLNPLILTHFLQRALLLCFA